MGRGGYLLPRQRLSLNKGIEMGNSFRPDTSPCIRMNSSLGATFRFYHAIHLNKNLMLEELAFFLYRRCLGVNLSLSVFYPCLLTFFLKKSLPCYKMERRKKQNTKGRQIESLPIDTLSQFPSNVRATAASLDECGALPSQLYPTRWKLVRCVG